MAVSQQMIVPIEHFIAAPLEALVRAQTMATRTSADFVWDIGFHRENGVNKANIVEFEYVHQQADPKDPSRQVDTPVCVRVPILSLLPVPHVEIEEATIDLNLRIVATQDTGETMKSGSGLPVEKNHVRLSGSFTTAKMAERTASLAVHMKVKQAPVPEGFAHLLSLLDEATTARSKEVPAAAPAETEPAAAEPKEG